MNSTLSVICFVCEERVIFNVEANQLPTLVEQFHRDGFLVLPGLLPAEDVAGLREGVEAVFARPSPVADIYGPYLAKIWRPLMFEHGPIFEALVDHPAIIDLIEALLGKDCHLIANSALCTGPDEAISAWHVDECVRVPLPPDVPLDPRIEMPCFVINLNYYLCDVDEELGPTQFVPSSHRAGRQPDKASFDAKGCPTYQGQSAVSTPGPAGTAVLWNDQTWHRGGLNTSQNRLRWVQQAPYARRFIAQRFYPFVNYRLPEGILERANPRRKRLLGLHAPGAFG